MKRPLIALLVRFTLAPTFAQFGSLAYTFRGQGTVSPPFRGFDLQVGGMVYLEPDWRGLFGVVRGRTT